MRHHQTQEKGRTEILLDYHLRVGQLTRDTRLPEGHAPHEQRLDETEVGAGTTVTLIDAKRPPEWVKETCLAKRYRPTQLVGELAGIRTDRGLSQSRRVGPAFLGTPCLQGRHHASRPLQLRVVDRGTRTSGRQSTATR